MEKILSTSEVGPILALIAPSPFTLECDWLSYLILSGRRIQSESKSESANTRAAEEYCYFSYDTDCFRVILWKNKIFYRHRHLHLTSSLCHWRTKNYPPPFKKKNLNKWPFYYNIYIFGVGVYFSIIQRYRHVQASFAFSNSV